MLKQRKILTKDERQFFSKKKRRQRKLGDKKYLVLKQRLEAGQPLFQNKVNTRYKFGKYQRYLKFAFKNYKFLKAVNIRNFERIKKINLMSFFRESIIKNFKEILNKNPNLSIHNKRKEYWRFYKNQIKNDKKIMQKIKYSLLHYIPKFYYSLSTKKPGIASKIINYNKINASIKKNHMHWLEKNKKKQTFYRGFIFNHTWNRFLKNPWKSNIAFLRHRFRPRVSKFRKLWFGSYKEYFLKSNIPLRFVVIAPEQVEDYIRTHKSTNPLKNKKRLKSLKNSKKKTKKKNKKKRRLKGSKKNLLLARKKSKILSYLKTYKKFNNSTIKKIKKSYNIKKSIIINPNIKNYNATNKKEYKRFLNKDWKTYKRIFPWLLKIFINKKQLNKRKLKYLKKKVKSSSLFKTKIFDSYFKQIEYSQFANPEVRYITRKKFAIIRITITNNNTSILITRSNGNIVFWATSATCGYESSKKATYMANLAVGTHICDLINESLLVKRVKIVFKGTHRRKKLKPLLKLFGKLARKKKIKILALINLNTIAYNGCRKKKKRNESH
jgi:ribosomal protein S11